jgi:hypothetical protein
LKEKDENEMQTQQALTTEQLLQQLDEQFTEKEKRRVGRCKSKDIKAHKTRN